MNSKAAIINTNTLKLNQLAKNTKAETVQGGFTSQNIISEKVKPQYRDSLNLTQNFVRKSQVTITTHESSFLMDWNETFCLKEQNKLNFTFCPQQLNINRCKQISNFKAVKKYSSQSLQKIILYALLYNHIHLLNYREKLPEILDLSKKCFGFIKLALIHQEKTNQIDGSTSISYGDVLKLIENGRISIQQAQELVVMILNTIDRSYATKIFRSILQQIRNERDRKMRKVDTAKFIKGEISEQELRQFGEGLGIRIKLSEQGKRISVGGKESVISIYVKKLREGDLFSLKKISCLQQSN